MNKSSRKKRLSTLAIGAILILILFNPIERFQWKFNELRLHHAVEAIDDSAEKVNLALLTPFAWDTVYSFDPYTPVDDIYKTIGYKWHPVKESVSEGTNQVIFLKEGKVVCYVHGYPESSGYFFDFTGSTPLQVAQKLMVIDSSDFHIEREKDYIRLTYAGR